MNFITPDTRKEVVHVQNEPILEEVNPIEVNKSEHEIYKIKINKFEEVGGMKYSSKFSQNKGKKKTEPKIKIKKI